MFVSLLLFQACTVIPRSAALQKEFFDFSSAKNDEIVLYEVNHTHQNNIDTWPSVRVIPEGFPKNVNFPKPKNIELGDTLMVTIWDSAENSLIMSPGQRYLELEPLEVNEQGNIHLPYVGHIKINNLSRDQAQTLINDKLKSISQSSESQIKNIISQYHSVKILSGVSNPGIYQINKPTYSLTDLLSDSGGVTGRPAETLVYVTRNGKLYSELLIEILKDPDLDIPLLPGDEIIFGKDPRLFVALGAVGQQSVYKFGKIETSALEAIAQIGGVNGEIADLGGILILRDYSKIWNNNEYDTTNIPAQRVVFQLNLTTADGVFAASRFKIQDRDVVYITESPVPSIERALSIFGNLVGFSE